MYAQYGIESLGLKKKTEKKHKKKLLPKTEIWCLVKRCVGEDANSDSEAAVDINEEDAEEQEEDI